MASVWHASGVCPDGLRAGGALTLGGESIGTPGFVLVYCLSQALGTLAPRRRYEEAVSVCSAAATRT